MVFTTPAFIPKLPFDPPDSVSIFDFVFGERFGRPPLAESPPPYIDGLTGKAYSTIEVKDRVEWLARALKEDLGWDPRQGTERDKVAGVFAVNTIDTLTVSFGIHRLNGISSPANAAYSAHELAYQLKASNASALFTCAPLLSTALEAAASAGIESEKIYLIDVPEVLLGGKSISARFKTVNGLIQDGKTLPPLQPLQWTKGQGARQIAFLCFSSGTSGLPKGVMISHRNSISNVLQNAMLEPPRADQANPPKGQGLGSVVLGLLPFSHIYGLVVIAMLTPFLGGRTIVLPKFEIKSYLKAIQDYQITTLYVVPPIIVAMLQNSKLCDQYRLPKEAVVWSGAAPLGKETAEDVTKHWCGWIVRQGYGLTETGPVVCQTSPADIDLGSSGCLVPGYEARIIDEQGADVNQHDTAGELWVRSPSIALGYLDNESATRETFTEDGWMKTGDKALFHKSPKGNEHVWIVDRMKELIKVKGMQVAPAELEDCLLAHSAVADAAVIPVPDERAGEVPKAFVVKATSVGVEENERALKRDIAKHVEKRKANHAWLRGGVEFVDEIPKTASGKILRRVFKDREKENRRKKGPRL